MAAPDSFISKPGSWVQFSVKKSIGKIDKSVSRILCKGFRWHEKNSLDN